jgi:cell division protease FtsH
VNKHWRQAGLYGLLMVVVIALATAFFKQPRQDIETWDYSRFISEVESGRIERIEISSDRTKAKFSNPNGEGTVIVNLPNDPELVKLLSTNDVDIAVKYRWR